MRRGGGLVSWVGGEGLLGLLLVCVWWDGGYLGCVWSLLGSCGGLLVRLRCM